MRKLNLYFGLLLFVLFLLSGYYMEAYFKPQHLDHLALRMEIRANHIYILFISLLNILAFKCDFSKVTKASDHLETSFRIALLASGLVALYAFVYDHNGMLTGRYETLASIILSLTAVAFCLINESIQYITKKDSYESN